MMMMIRTDAAFFLHAYLSIFGHVRVHTNKHMKVVNSIELKLDYTDKRTRQNTHDKRTNPFLCCVHLSMTPCSMSSELCLPVIGAGGVWMWRFSLNAKFMFLVVSCAINWNKCCNKINGVLFYFIAGSIYFVAAVRTCVRNNAAWDNEGRR